MGSGARKATRRLMVGFVLIGLGWYGRLLPDILLVLAAIYLLEGLRPPGQARRRRVALLVLAAWAILTFHLGIFEILILAGCSMIASSLWRRAIPGRGKPAFDASLE